MRYLCKGAALAICMVLGALTVLLVLPGLFGIHPLIVQSGSMEPAYPQGSMVYIRGTDPRKLSEGDAVTFRLADGEGTEFVVSGNSTSSEKTVTIITPFLHTAEQALAAARLILAQYGGNVYETAGRGDPAGEIPPGRSGTWTPFGLTRAARLPPGG